MSNSALLLPPLRLLYATVSGTAEAIARELAAAYRQDGAGTAEVADMHDTDPDSCFDPDGPVLLLCVATTGSGDVPDAGYALLGSLQLNPRFLGGLRYGVVALGDSSYGSTCCGGALQFDAVLQDLGATRVGDVLQLDACADDDVHQLAAKWFADWRTLL